MKQDKLIHKGIRIMLIVFIALTGLLSILFYLDPDARTGMLINYGKILFIFGAVLAIAFPIIFMILNPKNAIKLLIVVVIFVVLGGISYLFASGSIDGAVYEKFDVTSSSSRMIGGALVLTYILAGLTVASIIFSSISKMFK